MNAGYFLIQLSTEEDKSAIYKLIGEHSRADANGVAQVSGCKRQTTNRKLTMLTTTGVLHWSHQPPQPPRGDPRGGPRRSGRSSQVHSRRETGVYRRLRVQSLQH